MPSLMETERQIVELHPVQQQFCRSKALYRGFVGGRGSGKSWAISYDLIMRAKRGRLYLMASPTYTILADTDFRSFCAIARDLEVLGSKKMSPPEVTLTTGATVIFRSADDPDRLRGPNLSGAALNEASLMHRDAYDIAIACLREGGEQGWLSAGFTPAGLTHWTYDLFGQNPPRPNTECFHAHTRDNPFNPKGFARTLAGQYTPQRARQELGGEFVSLEGAEWPSDYFPESIWFSQWPNDAHENAIALDPSQGKGEKEKGCYASFVEARRDAKYVIWLECWASQSWDAKQLAERMATLNRERRPKGVSTELNGGQQFLVPILLQAAQATGIPLPLYGFEQKVDKEVRIRSLGPLLAQGRIRIRDTPGGRLLVQQMRDFPVGEFVDCCDAAEMACRLLMHLVHSGASVAGSPVLMR